jgi:hypothetical protein
MLIDTNIAVYLLNGDLYLAEILNGKKYMYHLLVS